MNDHPFAPARGKALPADAIGARSLGISPAGSRISALDAAAIRIGKRGLHGDVLRIAPPLIVSEVDEALEILRESFAAMST